MKKIVKEYGGYVQDAVIVIMLYLLIFRFLPAGNGTFGIGNVLGSKVSVDGKNYAAYKDFAVTSETLSRAKPVVTFNPYNAAGTRREITSGQPVVLASYFAATDAEGGVIADIKIKSIVDPTGTELLTDQLECTDTYQFTDPGMYRVRVTATDGRNQTSTRQFDIPVAREE